MDGKEALARFKESGVPVGFLRFMANERWAIAYEHSDWINAVADELERIRQDKATLAARLAEAEALLREASNWRMAIECVAPELGGAIMTLNRIDAFLAPDSASLSGNYCPHCDSALANPCDAAAAKTCPNRLADADQPGEAVNVR